jgi:hypothetical protein
MSFEGDLFCHVLIVSDDHIRGLSDFHFYMAHADISIIAPYICSNSRQPTK